MTNEQLYVAIGVPILFNAVLFGIFLAYMSAKFDSMQKQFEGVNQQFESVNKRFDDMRGLWRAELRRVEEVIDARLKHLEERR